MLLTPLVDKIEELRGTIRSRRDTVGAHELRTRVVLIDPILRMIGWPPEDPQSVVVEYATGTGRADYALLGESARPVALLEAKVLGSRLEEHTRQIVTYATETGIGSAGITDGDRWMLYDVFRPAPMEDKRVMDVRLTRDEPLAAALDLLAGLTRPALSPPQTEVGRGQAPGRAKDYGRTAPGGEWTTVAALEEPQAVKAGAELRFPDGKTWEARIWQHAVGRVAEWLVTTGRLPEERLPLRVGDIVRGSTGSRSTATACALTACTSSAPRVDGRCTSTRTARGRPAWATSAACWTVAGSRNGTCQSESSAGQLQTDPLPASRAGRPRRQSSRVACRVR